jgi:hypothetical protein
VRITLAAAQAHFTERELVEAGFAGRIKATCAEGEISHDEWGALRGLTDGTLRQVIHGHANRIWSGFGGLASGHDKTRVRIEFIRMPGSRRRQAGDTSRQRAELLCAAARPHLPGSLLWSADRAFSEALTIKPNEPLLNISRSRRGEAWGLAKKTLRQELATKEQPPDR